METLRLKTATEVERDIYSFVKEGAIGKTITGQVYRQKRPRDSKQEDAVVIFIAGEDSLMQSGILSVNVYVQDIPGVDNMLTCNMARCAEIERAIRDFLDDFACDDGYWLESDGTPQPEQEEGTVEHRVTLRLRFKRRAS